MEQVAQLITNYGMSVALLAWMIYKDYKFNAQILGVLEKINIILARVETWHSVEEKE